VQALALQKMGIVPDRLIHLNVKPSASLARLKNNLIGINQALYGPELEELANQCLQEYELNMRGVRSAFNQFIFDHNATDKAQSDVEKELHKMLYLRYKNGAPLRPPRVIIVGPPGSGKTEQANALCETYGLVKISVQDLLRSEIQSNPDNGKQISECID